MRYRHKKTGTVIDISAVLTSPDWEEVKEKKSGKKAEEQKAEDKDGEKTVCTDQ